MGFEVDGLDETVDMLDGVEKRYEQIRRGTAPILKVVAADIRTLIDDSFQNSVSPAGIPFAPLTPSSAAARDPRVFSGGRAALGSFEGERRAGPLVPRRRRRRRRFIGPVFMKPLVDTGLLRNSITTIPVPGGVRFGTNKIQAATHQFGREDNTIGGHAAPIPARPYLPIDATGSRFETRGAAGKLLADLQQDVARWITEGR